MYIPNDTHFVQDADGKYRPGKVLSLFGQLRFGALVKQTKPGVNFAVRDYSDLIDKISARAEELGLLIYPVNVQGSGSVVEGEDRQGKVRTGSMASVTVYLRVQAIEDGSYITLAGYGLGMDTQDKAGGKAGTYAMKQALVQGLLAGGTIAGKALGVTDTDDDSAPIPGGPRKRAAKSKVKDPGAAPKPTPDIVTAALQGAQNREGYEAALALARQLQPAEQVAIKPAVVEAAQRIRAAESPQPTV